jgi:hypothetical protein
MCWVCGEYMIARIFLIIIVTFTIILCCINCFKDYSKNVEGCIITCYYYIRYKKAEVVPIQNAIQTTLPVNTMGVPSRTETAIIIYD